MPLSVRGHSRKPSCGRCSMPPGPEPGLSNSRTESQRVQVRSRPGPPSETIGPHRWMRIRQSRRTDSLILACSGHSPITLTRAMSRIGQRPLMPLSVREICRRERGWPTRCQSSCSARWDLADSAAAEVGVGADLVSRVLLLPALVSTGFAEGPAEPAGRLPCVSQRLFL
jgi:hypothetical protein